MPVARFGIGNALADPSEFKAVWFVNHRESHAWMNTCADTPVTPVFAMFDMRVLKVQAPFGFTLLPVPLVLQTSKVRVGSATTDRSVIVRQRSSLHSGGE